MRSGINDLLTDRPPVAVKVGALMKGAKEPARKIEIPTVHPRGSGPGDRNRRSVQLQPLNRRPRQLQRNMMIALSLFVRLFFRTPMALILSLPSCCCNFRLGGNLRGAITELVQQRFVNNVFLTAIDIYYEGWGQSIIFLFRNTLVIIINFL